MRILILGWYGTETVGDKAILGGIINYYKDVYNEPDFVIASIYPFITKQTVYELEIEAEIILSYSFQFIQYCASSDLVVMGGGPLMDLEALSIPLWGFQIAKLFRKRRVIFGCGLGPLNNKRYKTAVARILSLANEVMLRDTNSIELAKTLNHRPDYKLYGDPAEYYIQSLKNSLVSTTKQTPRIAVFLRDWTHEYASHLDHIQFKAIKERFEKELAEGIKKVITSMPSSPSVILYPMHCFAIGNDDRVFNRSFASKYLSSVDVIVVNEPSTVSSIAHAMINADVCICMRFHSVVFAHTLDRKFLALDYTFQGKIYGFLKDKNALRSYVSVVDFDQELFIDELSSLLS